MARRDRPFWPLLLPLMALGFTGVFYGLSVWLGTRGIECGILQWTGYYCPGCGGTRCAGALARGEIIEAMQWNALLATGAILFTLGSLYLIVRFTLLGQPAPNLSALSPRWTWAGIGIIVLFTLLRNTSTFSWLAP